MQDGILESPQSRAPFGAPKPALRVRNDGVLLSANAGATTLLSEWKCEVGQIVPDEVRQAVERALAENSPAELEARPGGRDYCLLVVPIAECGYAGIFGTDVTEEKRAAERLRQRAEDLETLANASPLYDAAGQAGGCVGAFLDMTRHKHAGQARRESQAREYARSAELQAIMDAVPAATLIARDPEYREIAGNRTAHELLQRLSVSIGSISSAEDLQRAGLRILSDGRDLPWDELPLRRAAITGQPVRDQELEVVLKNGSRCWVIGSAVPVFGDDGRRLGVVGAFLDITDRKRNEMRLRQVEKLESIALLAGGVAHDFNNLLVGVIGSASLARDMLPPDSPVDELLQQVIRSGQQAAHLTEQMLAYSGHGRYIMEPVDLSGVVREVAGLVSSAAPGNVTTRLKLKRRLPAIEADRSQVHQVLMNLVMNAAEAIGDGMGSVVVRTGSQDADQRLVEDGTETPPGGYVFLEVRDTGCGMDDTVRARMFDPFFTTKFQGRGLGLAAVAGIVRSHKGAIRVTTAPGRGTSIRVLFPALEHRALRASQHQKTGFL